MYGHLTKVAKLGISKVGTSLIFRDFSMFAKETGKVKTQKPEKKTLRKMKREFDDFFDEESRKAKIKKPRRGQKELLFEHEEGTDPE